MRKTLLLLAMLAPGIGLAGQSLDLNLSGDAIRGEFSSDTGLLPNSNGELSIGGLYSDDDNADFTMGHVGLLVTGDAGARSALVKAGLGVRLVGLDVNGGDANGGAVALGGAVDARLPAYNRIGVGAYLYYAPDVSAFGDIDKYLEYAANINYELIRNAFVYIGARQVRLGFDPGSEMSVDTGAHAGFFLEF
tara:strand:- start:202 stop:777 length:576 start_codon:yes stop_codon:yes gene_type:complete